MVTPKSQLLSGEAIFEYDNYRTFLKDYFAEQRKCNRFFSHRYFAMKAGFNSHSFCDNVIKGKRNLTMDSMRRMMKGLRLKGKAASFFQALVMYNQAKTIQDRIDFLKRLDQIRKTTKFYKVHQGQYSYYNEWYYPIIRELAVYADWKNNYQVLAEMVRPPISKDEAKDAVKTLVEIGLLKKGKNGKYRQNEQALTAEGVPGFIFKKAKTESILKAVESIDNVHPAKRHVTNYTLAMSRKTFETMKQEMDELCKRTLVAATQDEEVDRVYVLNVQAFPVTQDINYTGKKGK